MKSKKLLSLLLALAMVMSITACGGKTETPAGTDDSGNTDVSTEELNWPEKEILLIQPWSLGGGPDVITRQIASYSDKILGVPMIVETTPAAPAPSV